MQTQDNFSLALVYIMHTQATYFSVMRLVWIAGQAGEPLVRCTNYGHMALLCTYYNSLPGLRRQPPAAFSALARFLTHYLSRPLSRLSHFLAEVWHDFVCHHFLEFQDEVIGHLTDVAACHQHVGV